jgi:hypothetical protein
MVFAMRSIPSSSGVEAVEVWVGPAIVAALVSATVSAIGWFVTFRATLRLEQVRRDEKVHDFQVALRAEIDSDLLVMIVVDRTAFLEEISERYRADLTYSVLVPQLSSNVVFEAIVKDIPILPASVIAPVIHYARLRQTIAQFVEDLRSQSFPKLAAERQLVMYSDYLDMLGRLEVLSRNALAALDASLNTPAVALPNPKSASGAGEASAEQSVSP